MQFDPLNSIYAAKTDDELLLLAADRDSLTENAKHALANELRHRNISASSAPEVSSLFPSETETQAEKETEADTKSPLAWLGLFFVNTFVVYMCALHISGMLVGSWFAWFAPIFGTPIPARPAEWYLLHLEVMTIIPALVAGYADLGRFLPTLVGKRISDRRSSSAGSFAWTIPTASLLYKMMQFHAPSSVLLGSSMSAFKYFFDIQQVMPSFADLLAGNPRRVLAQMTITAPFYAGVAYSLGSLAWRHRVLSRLLAFGPGPRHSFS